MKVSRIKKEVIQVLRDPIFLVPSGIIFLGVTLLYISRFKYSLDTNWVDILLYWGMYLLVMLVLQLAIYVNVKNQVLKK